MPSALLSLILALSVAATATPLVRRLALALGAVDTPSGRRVHASRIPRLGGLAIIAGFFVPLLVLFALNTSVAQMFFSRPVLVAGLVIGSLTCAGLGAFDDIVGVGAKVKLLVQSGAAAVAFFAGFRIELVTLPWGPTVALGWMALPATVLWIVAIVNAINLIDGLDGLAGGVAFFACITNFVVAWMSGNVLITLLAATLAGAIVGFLWHNFNPATIFMGDTGSMFLGFVLATTSLVGSVSQKGQTAIAILVPILALGLPIMDTLLAMVRRFLERRSIFSPDRGHIHHRLLDMGITHRRAVLILYGASVAFTVGSLVVYVGRSWQVGLALVALAVGVVGMIRFVGYFNYMMLRRRQKAHARDADVEGFRRTVPLAVARIDGSRGEDELRQQLATFGEVAGLQLVEVLSDTQRVWAWTLNEAEPRTRSSVSAKYPLAHPGAERVELKFAWDSDDGDVSPQADILLQLVADAVDRQLQRRARARDSIREGRLRPVG